MFTHSARSWCLVVLLLVSLMTDTVASVAFTPVSDDFGQVLCAVDQPSFSVTVESVEELKDLPYAIQCGFRCSSYSHNPPCTSFNVLSDKGLANLAACNGDARRCGDAIRCQMYTSTPQSLLIVESCKLYSANTRSLCAGKSAYVDHIANEDCSYPFTYNGQLYYNCTTNVVRVTSTCEPYACFTANRTAAVCDNPNFIAYNESTNLTVASTPSMSIMSVFGWIIFQQRTPVSPAFNWGRRWSEYKNGFGSIGSNFWLGLERVHLMSSSTKYRLRIEMRMISTGRWYSVEYWSFIIGDESVTKYRLNVDGYSGDGGDGLRYGKPGSRWYHNGMPFSTNDVNNVPKAWTNCASTLAGGWWFNDCYWVCLTCGDDSTEWDSVPDTSYYLLSTTRMMIKQQ